jgi:hypothetical protein
MAPTPNLWLPLAVALGAHHPSDDQREELRRLSAAARRLFEQAEGLPSDSGRRQELVAVATAVSRAVARGDAAVATDALRQLAAHGRPIEANPSEMGR